MKITAIMTARNAGRTIGLAVSSTLLAMARHDELLVFLDASEDSSLEKLRSIRDSRLFVFENSGPPVGAAAGRNKLIGRATGNLVAIIDADDICLPWRFRVAREQMGKNDAIFSTAIILREFRRGWLALPQLFRSIPAGLVALELLHRNPFVHSSFVVRTQVIRDVGGYQDGSLLEDLDLYLRLVIAGKSLRRLSLPSVVYRQHQGQISRSAEVTAAERRSDRIDELRKELATTLGLGGMSSDECKSSARHLCSQRGLFARLEIVGLRGLLTHAAFWRRNL